jgi:hypothetical protein
MMRSEQYMKWHVNGRLGSERAQRMYSHYPSDILSDNFLGKMLPRAGQERAMGRKTE